MFSQLKNKAFLINKICFYCTSRLSQPLRSKKPKSKSSNVQNFVDLKELRTIGGKGGDGCISFLSIFGNEFAGPDGGDGGNGGHVIFQADTGTKDLSKIKTVEQAASGGKGRNKDCHGKNAPHLILKVPIGTIIKNQLGKVVGDLSSENLIFVAARGGAGGKGNHFFVSDVNQAPEVAEFGAPGEDLEYVIEIKSMAHIGLIGFPNAGKSTLLQAISRARPKIAPYPFTTLKPHLGMVQYNDYTQIAIADLPGIIPDSHKNKGLGIQFLKHIERCLAMLFIIDVSDEKPWEHLEVLQNELDKFNADLTKRPQLLIANKIDLELAEENLEELRKRTSLKVIPISAKKGTNLKQLLDEIRILYDQNIDSSN